MRKLDPQLEFLIEGGEAVAAEGVDAVVQFGLEATVTKGKSKKPSFEVSVLVQYAGDPKDLVKAGMAVHGIAGDVVTGQIAIGDLAKLTQIDEVERIEAGRPMQPELDLSVPEIRADLVHAGPPGRRGTGVIVGIVDTGCDYTHPAFRNSDGTTRILSIWDQGLVPKSGESGPASYGFGVEYNEAKINRALASRSPFNIVRHHDYEPLPHGTHVAGIAAGNGRGSSSDQPAGTYVGVAPEADLIIVGSRSNGGEGLGTSANTLDAVNYIFQRAQALDRPCVINMSLGDNLGPHDGTSLLERGIDNLLGAKGRAFVKSAGNAGSARAHAQGYVSTGTNVDLRFNQPGGDLYANQIDLWYEGSDTFRFSVMDPAGQVVGPVSVGNALTLNLPSGNRVRIDHRNNDPFNGDKRVFMTFFRGSIGEIQSGTWRIRIQSVSSAGGGRFDAWVQRGSSTPQFLAPHESKAITISTPGSAREVITAANYSAPRGLSTGALTASSSRGPTRDGRPAPTLAAPGTDVWAPRAEFGDGNPNWQLTGTSMSAPHITGTIALMFQKNKNRTQAEIKDCLTSTARTDGNTGPVPNTAWGAGKLDAKAAVDCVPGLSTFSVPTFTCVRSVIGSTCQSVAIRCLSVPATTCGRSVLLRQCFSISVPRTTCLGPSVVATDCRSWADGCPSTPRGCFNRNRSVDPTTRTRFDLNMSGEGFRPFQRGDDTPWSGVEVGSRDTEVDWTSEGEISLDQPVEIELPPEGYFEYDDSWFDDE